MLPALATFHPTAFFAILLVAAPCLLLAGLLQLALNKQPQKTGLWLLIGALVCFVASIIFFAGQFFRVF